MSSVRAVVVALIAFSGLVFYRRKRSIASHKLPNQSEPEHQGTYTAGQQQSDLPRAQHTSLIPDPPEAEQTTIDTKHRTGKVKKSRAAMFRDRALKPIGIYTAALVLLAFAQWWSTDGQLDAMRDQLTLMRDQIQLDQRAWVAVTSTHLSQFAADKEIFVDFLITNTGKTPARRVRFRRLFAWRMPTETDLKSLQDSSSSDPNLAPGEKRTQRFTVTPAVHPERYKAILSGGMTFSVIGEFSYLDIFTGEERSTPICVYFEARSAPLMSSCSVGTRDMK